MSGPDYIVDIDGLRHLNAQDGRDRAAWRGERSCDDGMGPSDGEGGAAGGVGRPWIAVRWKCCSTYSRIYRDRGGQHYAGTCPKCGRPVRARIGPDGTPARFFEAE